MAIKTDQPHQGQYKIPKFFGKVDIKKEVDGEVVVYLRRWYLFRLPMFWSKDPKKRTTGLFSIRLHHIQYPDTDRYPHDHPWPFVSFILRGGYRERWDTAGHWSPRYRRHVKRVSFHTRTDLHLIDGFDRGSGPEGGAWTMIFTGRERKKYGSDKGWGFMTPEGWIPWNRYAPAGPVGPCPGGWVGEEPD